MNKKGGVLGWAFFFLALLLAIGFFFTIPLPRDTTQVYTVKEPYTTTEQYQEYVPISVESCKTDLPKTNLDAIFRTINWLNEGDIKVLYETCENVDKLEQVTKTRQVTKYKDVRRTRTVTIHETLYERWIG